MELGYGAIGLTPECRMTHTIATLKITLDYVQSGVSRTIDAPYDIRLDRLHLAIQAAMGWTNSHLYMFLFKDARFGIPDPEWDNDTLDARKVTLAKAIMDTGLKTFKYIYDFGDDWCHTIKLEQLSPADANISYPVLTSCVGRCPPEDVGGPPGFEAFLEAINDPTHERHDEMLQWHGTSFDPANVDTQKIASDLQKLHKAWNRFRKPKA